MQRTVPNTQEEIGSFVESILVEIQEHHARISDLRMLLERVQTTCQHPEHGVDGWSKTYCKVCGKEQ